MLIGPGLGIRCLCSPISGNSNEDFEDSNLKLNEICKKYEYSSSILPIQSVGVQGDGRTYKNLALIYSKNKNINWDLLEKLSTEITNSINQINRVALLISNEDFNKSEFQLSKSYVCEERLKILREADSMVTKFMIEKDLLMQIWQMPVALAPYGTKEKPECIILRPVNSKEAMTAEFFKLDPIILKTLVENILKNISKVSIVLYDITNKPPGTIELE